MEMLIVFLSLVALTLGQFIQQTPICVKLEEPLTKTADGYNRMILHGRITGDTVPATWLNINLVDSELGCENPITANIPLHLVPRVGSGHVVRNTWVAWETDICIGECTQGWGPEETAGGFPFEVNKWFEIIILCQDTSFEIYVDGKFFAAYKYRMPLERVTHLMIDGRGEFKKIGVIRPKSKSEF